MKIIFSLENDNKKTFFNLKVFPFENVGMACADEKREWKIL
jgi:hypothetical protein